MSQYTTTSTETLKSEDTIAEEDYASISNDNRSSTAQSSVEDYLEILNAPTSQTTTSSNQSIEFEVYKRLDFAGFFYQNPYILL